MDTFLADLRYAVRQLEVRPTDLVTHVGAAALLVLVAIAASALPAWRAARVAPVIALRTE